jgi:ribosomal protein L30E
MALKDDLKTKKPILGLDRALKGIRRQKLSKVYVASNSQSKDKIERLGATMKVEIINTEENSRELGVLCKKPFAVSVISFE